MDHCSYIDQKIFDRKKEGRKKLSKNPLFKAAKGIQFDSSSVNIHDCGEMTVECEKGCGAKHFLCEKARYICCDKNGRNGSHNFMNPLPVILEELLRQKDF